MADVFLWAAVVLGVGYAIFRVIMYFCAPLKRDAAELARRAMDGLEGKSHTLPMYAYESEEDAINEALSENNMPLLTAYANLTEKVSTWAIIAAVESIRYAEKSGVAGELTAESLTANHVDVFFSVSIAADPEISARTLLQSDANKLGIFAMQNLDDYDLILSLVKDRRARTLADVEALLHEMKTLPSGALIEGCL